MHEIAHNAPGSTPILRTAPGQRLHRSFVPRTRAVSRPREGAAQATTVLTVARPRSVQARQQRVVRQSFVARLAVAQQAESTI